MSSWDDLSEYIQSFLPRDDSHYYSVFIVEEDNVTKMTVVRMPSHNLENFYKIDRYFDSDSKTTDDLILLAKMCAHVIESELSK